MYFYEYERVAKTVKYSRVNRNTVNLILGKLGLRIVQESIANAISVGEFEVDGSYLKEKELEAN